jgi:hypothetical protein
MKGALGQIVGQKNVQLAHDIGITPSGPGAEFY